MTWRLARHTAGSGGWRSWPGSLVTSPCLRRSSSRCGCRSAPPYTDSLARNLQYWRWFDYLLTPLQPLISNELQGWGKLETARRCILWAGELSVLPWGLIFCYVKSFYWPVKANATTAKPAAAEMKESQRKIFRWKAPNCPMWSRTLS